MIVTVTEAWAIYTPTIPANSVAIGTVAIAGNRIGALVRLPGGALVQVNAGVVRSLDQRVAELALSAAENLVRMMTSLDGLNTAK